MGMLIFNADEKIAEFASKSNFQLTVFGDGSYMVEVGSQSINENLKSFFHLAVDYGVKLERQTPNKNKLGLTGEEFLKNAITATQVIKNAGFSFLAKEKENPMTKPNDPVNHPSHYTSHPSGVECIEITRHMTFNIGNVIKYVWRSGLKEGQPSLQDLQKARWYLDDEIKRIEALQKNG